MRGAFHRCSARWIALLAILWGGCWRTSAQRITEDVEPKWFRGQLNSASLGVYTEGYYEKVDYHNGISSTYERMFEGPLIGLGMNGAIYHPNLLQYEFNGDGSVGWTQEKSTSSNDGSVRRNQYEYLG